MSPRTTFRFGCDARTVATARRGRSCRRSTPGCASTRRAASVEPMKPAPPVMKTFAPRRLQRWSLVAVAEREDLEVGRRGQATASVVDRGRPAEVSGPQCSVLGVVGLTIAASHAPPRWYGANPAAGAPRRCTADRGRPRSRRAVQRLDGAKTPENAVSLTPPRYASPSTATVSPSRSPSRSASRPTAYAGMAALARGARRPALGVGSPRGTAAGRPGCSGRRRRCPAGGCGCTAGCCRPR